VLDPFESPILEPLYPRMVAIPFAGRRGTVTPSFSAETGIVWTGNLFHELGWPERSMPRAAHVSTLPQPEGRNQTTLMLPETGTAVLERKNGSQRV